jgi:hypothetical protein
LNDLVGFKTASKGGGLYEFRFFKNSCTQLKSVSKCLLHTSLPGIERGCECCEKQSQTS